MPRIDGGDAIGGQWVRGIARRRSECTVDNDSCCNLLDCITDAVSDGRRSMFVAGIRRFRHQDAQVTRGYWAVGQFERHDATLRISQSTRREDMPFTLWTEVEIQRASPCPVLHLVVGGIGTGPDDTHRVNQLLTLQVYDHPLRMKGITFASEHAGQIGISL